MRGYAMSNYKIFTLNYRGWILISVIFFLFAQVSISYGAGRLLVWPVKEEVTQTKARVSLKSHEVRKGKIALSQDILPKTAGAVNHQARIVPSKGDTISINLFDDVKYDVKVYSVNHNADGTIIVNGILKDHKMRTVVMTIGSDGYLLTVQDMNKDLLYRVSGNSSDGSGSVTEIDMKKMPPVIR
jgi:hypothetical protein